MRASERSQQAFYVPMPIDPHPRAAVWLVRAEDEIVRILLAPVEQRAHGAFMLFSITIPGERSINHG